MLDVLKLKRNNTFIKKNCKLIGNALVATADISVYLPYSFENTALLSLGDRYYSLGSLMYTDGKEYSVMNLMVSVELGITPYSRVMIMGMDGEECECYEFKYSKGDKIHPTNEVPKVASLAYPAINAHILAGRTVPFFDVEDVDGILDSLPRLAMVGLPEYGYVAHYPEMVSRSSENLKVPFRLSKGKHLTVIPFSSVLLNVSSVIGMNQGGYLEDGMQTSTMTESKSSTTFEKVMRS